MKIYKKYYLHNLILPLSSCGISAGFPSPADDHLEDVIDLNHQLIRNKEATFFGRAEGDSMIDAGIGNGDLLVIDKSLSPKNNDIAVCFLDGEFTVKRIKIEKNIIWLVAENKNYKPIKVTKENEFVIWGIVTHCIKDL
ncbi:translesion error-prone DNA polymerase V autoproteolytic subunit [Salegentibacter maritimus]|uniref:Translesion error-prone DNA polymerase V autoproteolytic subunit n=1 Tax=Salegentibacter maritimus TaxID=2794347 RepID=A0ABS0TG72_9FLAO|nr:translesion error-prone DNA polymerase V autoproteolytic subunit [Salegentibacter maritimus]MBI6119637.1 translesion error-prone DNA polymerase V autoproteolytic subunit [Salegentibacter maritimus]